MRERIIVAAGLWLGVTGILSAQTVGHVFSANLSGNHVAQHDPVSGEYVGSFVAPGSGGLTGATGIAFGPNDVLFVASSRTHQILRFDAASGAFIDAFISDTVLRSPFSVIVGPDGDLYVSSGTDHRVLRYDGVTGALLDIVAEGLQVPIGLRFGQDGTLYIANAGAHQVVRVDPEGGEIEVLVAEGLRFPSDIVFTADGQLLVTSAFTREVVAYDAGTWERRGVVVELPEGAAPVGIDLALDGDVLVADFAGSRIFKVSRDGSRVRELTDGLAGPENIVVKRW